MTSSRVAIVERSPLDQIQQAEVDVTRRVAAARQAAEDAIREARAQAADLKRQARETGRQEGLAEIEAIVSGAEREAERLIEQAHSQARGLRRRGDLFGETAVRYAIAVVTGQETGGQ